MPRLRIQHQAVPEPATHRDIRTQRPFLHVLRAIVSGCRLDSCRSSRTRSPGRYGQRASCLRFNCPMRRRRCCEHLAKAVSYPVEQGLVQPVCFKVSRTPSSAWLSRSRNDTEVVPLDNSRSTWTSAAAVLVLLARLR